MGERNPEANQLEIMLADCQRLKEENAKLRRLLVENGITIPAPCQSGSPPPAKAHVQDAGVNEHSGKDAKIALAQGGLMAVDSLHHLIPILRPERPLHQVWMFRRRKEGEPVDPTMFANPVSTCT